MILCVMNDYRYYGETSTVSGRLASHKSMLRRNIHPNTLLQTDWNLYSEPCFEFVVLYIGMDWKVTDTRRDMESTLIVKDKERCYNMFASPADRTGNTNPFYQKRHSEKTKLLMSLVKKNIPNDILVPTRSRRIRIQGTIFPSIAQASRELGHSRKTIRDRMHSKDFPEWEILEKKVDT